MVKEPEIVTTETKLREYEAPEVQTEEVFETLALTCTKAVAQCTVNPGTFTVRS